MAKSKAKGAAKKPPRPRRKPNQIVDVGGRAHALASEDRVLIEPRLPPALIDGIGADLEAFGVKVPGVLQDRAEKLAATLEQGAKAQTAVDIINGIRTSISSAPELGAAAKKRFAVGQRVSPGVIRTVVAAGNMILGSAEENPEEARTAGILPSDLEALRVALDATRGADRTQEGKKASSVLSTRGRDATARRLEAAIRRVSAAGQLAFASDAERRSEYAALVGGAKGRKKAPTKTDPKTE